MTTSVEPPAELLSPTDQSLRAIEHAQQLLQSALTALDSGDDERLNQAYEQSAECADNIGRALWFLRRMAREGEAPRG